MRHHSLRLLGSLIIAVSFATTHDARAADEPPRYLDARSLESRLRTVCNEHAVLAHVETYGTSRGGRPLYAAVLGNSRLGELTSRPGLLIVANLDGRHLLSSAVALANVEALLKGYGNDEAVTKLLDQHVI